MIRMSGNITFNHNPHLKTEARPGRAVLVLVLLFAGFLALVVRAVYLQVVHTDFLQTKGAQRYERVLELPAVRGTVMDRNGDVLAKSSPVKTVWAVPEDAAKMSASQLRTLASMLGMDVNDIERKLAATGKDFVYIKRQVSPEDADRIAAMKFPGIHSLREYKRFYPKGEEAAHILGFTGVDGRGQEGIELAFERVLAGVPGSRGVIKDRRGNVVEDVGDIRQPQDGQDVVLSVDAKIQYLAHTALRQALTDHKAKAGGVVVLDAQTGEVLALANLPTYNPNKREALSGAQLRNRALTDTYEPGSTMKPFTAAMALENGKYRFNTLVNCARVV